MHRSPIRSRSRHLPSFRRPSLRRPLAVLLALAIVAITAACGSESTDPSDTTEPASQFGSSMGTQSGTVADVAALGDGPGADEVWTVPVGVSICGRFVDVPTGGQVDGVTSDGAFALVSDPGGGTTPTIGAFAESAGVDLGAGRVSIPQGVVPPELDNTDPPTPVAGATFASGDMCGDVTGEVQVWVYSGDARRSGDGILVLTRDLGNVPFSDPEMAVVIAFTPESSLPTLPPSASTL